MIISSCWEKHPVMEKDNPTGGFLSNLYSCSLVKNVQIRKEVGNELLTLLDTRGNNNAGVGMNCTRAMPCLQRFSSLRTWRICSWRLLEHEI